MLDLREVPAIVRAIELGDPQALFILDDRFWPRAAHRRSDQHKLLRLDGVGVLFVDLAAYNVVGDFLKLREVQRLVKRAAGRWRLLA